MQLSDYADDPVAFVREVLGGDPWEKQEEILRAVRDYPRVTVRSCHGVGKTYTAACAVLWRVHCFCPSVVLTTAPGHRQVKDVLWRQIRALHRRARVRLPGQLLETALKIAEDTFALGFATDEGDRFQGFHGPHLFIVVEEAAGVPEVIFEAIDGCLTTEGARLLLIGNPTRSTGRFAESHRREGWHKIKISAFDSPNLRHATLPITAFPAVQRGTGQAVPTATPGPFPATVGSRGDALDTDRPEPEALLWPDPVRRELVTVRWVVERGEEWGPESPIYQARVLGEFPDSSEDRLVPLAWLERAAQRRREAARARGEAVSADRAKKVIEGLLTLETDETLSLPTTLAGESKEGRWPVELGVDVARYGDCESVVVVRRGGLVTRVVAWRGADLMATVGRVAAIAAQECPALGSAASTAAALEGGSPPPHSLSGARHCLIKVDSIGLGAGVVDRLRELGLPAAGVNVARRAWDPERFERRRDELYFALRERFRRGEIALDDEPTAAQLSSLRFRYTSGGQLVVESKEELRARGLRSPDRADALMLAFAPVARGPLPAAQAGPARHP